MTFFNSVQGSTAIGTQAQIAQQTTASNTGTQMTISLSDIVSMQTGFTTQLAGIASVLTSACTLNFVSCVITGLLS